MKEDEVWSTKQITELRWYAVP